MSPICTSAAGGNSLTFSASCPSEILAKIQSGDALSESEVKLYLKDRQKKDNHNQIERRRRFNINDRIKELGGMLPKGNDPEFRANKGSILKATVDYIKKLEAERDKFRKGEIREKESGKNYEKLCKNMFLRIQELEKHARDNGWVVPGGDGLGADSVMETMLASVGSALDVKPKDNLTRVEKMQQPIHQQQQLQQQQPQQQQQNQSYIGKQYKASPSQLSSTPVVTLSPPEYQGYSVSPHQDGRISLQNSAPNNQQTAILDSQFQQQQQQQQHQQQQQQQHQQQHQNTFPIVQLAQDGNATITFVQCDPVTGNANGNYFDGVVLKQEPTEQASGQRMEYGVDCNNFATMVQSNDTFMVDDANQMFSNSYSPQNFDETVREALDLL